MNNEQNNILGNITPVFPNNTNQQSPSTNQTSNNSLKEIIPPTPIPITPISPKKEETITPNQNPDNLTKIVPSQVQPITPKIIIPESKNNTISTPQPQNTIPELKLESSSPFDIGVNPQLNTTTSINTETTYSKVSPTIIPTNVPNNINNNDQTSPDINIQVPEANIPNDNIVTVGSYILHMILFAIPVVGFIMLIIKALDKNNKNISNFAKAELIIAVIATILSILIFIIFGSYFTNTLTDNSMINNYQTINYDY